MRMRNLLLIAAVSLAAPATAAPPNSGMTYYGAKDPSCPATSRYEASRRGKSPKAQKLTELPPADAYLTVWRKVGACEAPIIVRYHVGSSQGRK
jgi:hypothetical protein